jgi:multiple sugar transport system substrate-binding protein
MKSIRRSTVLLTLLALLLSACGGGSAPQGSATPGVSAQATAAPASAATAVPSAETQATAAPAQATEATAAPAAVATGDKVTLTLWIFEGEDQFLPKLQEAFTAKYPNITLEITNIPEDQYVTKIDTALAANDPPDISFIYERRWIKAGKFLPLDDMITAKGINLKTFNQGIMQDSCTYEGKVYCVGSYTGAVVLFYNKEMFDAAGVAYPATTQAMTLDEYAVAAAKLSKPNEDIQQRIWGTASAGAPYWWMDQRTEFSEDGRKTDGLVNDDETEHTYAILAQMVKDGYAPSSSQMQAMGETDLFAQKKAAMTIGDFSALSTLENEGIQYGVAPVPAPKDTKPWVPVWTDAFGVFSQSKHPAEVKEFLAFLATEGQRLRVTVAGDVPLDNAIADEVNWAGNNPGRKQFLDVIKLARPGVFVPGFWDVTTPLNDAFNAIVEGNKTAKEALDEAAPQMQESLNKAWETWEQIK